MSSIVVLRQTDRVSVLTDGAAYRNDGTIVGENAKVYALPHLNAVITVRGSQAAFAMIAGWLTCNVFAYNDLRHSLPEILSVLTPADGAGETIEVVVAGFTNAGGADSFFIVNHDRHPEAPILKALTIGGISMMPGGDSVKVAVEPLFPVPMTNVDQLDPEEIGLAIMGAQRQILDDVPGLLRAAKAHLVGRFAQMTSIYRDHIDTRILKRWPDPIGDKINPNVLN
ncbi:MAG TPA: hypothetical protein VGM83_05815 [Devosiaceae bacterium]|jgi:hypothetical protein